MMQEHDLHELAELVSEEAPILSLYLNMERHSRSPETFKLTLRGLLAQGATLDAAAADIERCERFFEHEYDRQGRGVACFSCQARKFWRAYPLLVPVQNMVFVGRRPFIKPLSDLWDNYDRFAVLMADREGARAFVYHLGALVDTAGTLGAEVKRHKQGGWAAQKLQRHEDQEARQNLKEAAEWANAYLAGHKVTRVVLSGTDANLAELRSQLPRALLDKVVGQVTLDMSATPAEVWERGFEVAQAAQREAEEALLEEVITQAHKGGGAVIGLADTLTAAQQGRIHQLLLDPELHVAGLQCTNCHAVILETQSACPYCGGTLAPTADAVNLVVHQSLEAGVKVSALASSERLAEVGGIAAVLRY